MANTKRSISMSDEVWSAVDRVSLAETHGVRSAAFTLLVTEALEHRGMDTSLLRAAPKMDARFNPQTGCYEVWVVGQFETSRSKLAR
jgi:hypothetical protein